MLSTVITKVTLGKNYQYPSCTATFLFSPQHLKHYRNDNYLCEICQKSSRSLLYLRKCIKIFSEEQPLTGLSENICHKVQTEDLSKSPFQFIWQLQYQAIYAVLLSVIPAISGNKRIHAGVKPYSCKICDKQCKRSSELKSCIQVYLIRRTNVGYLNHRDINLTFVFLPTYIFNKTTVSNEEE